MDKTIQGKTKNEIFSELSNLLKEEDYKFKEGTNQAYFPSQTVFNKARNLLGFNLETETIPLNNGKLYDITKECDQVVVSTHVRTTIRYDDGTDCCHVSSIGSYALETKKSGSYMPIVDAVKSAQTVAKKLALLEFIRIPAKPKNKANVTQGSEIKKYELQITRAGVLLNNGMIKAVVSHNGIPKVLTIYKEDVAKICTAVKSNADAVSASLKPGMSIVVLGREQTYNNEQQVVLKNFSGNVFPTVATHKSVQPQDSGNTTIKGFRVCVTGDASLQDNGIITIPCTLNKELIDMVIYPNVVKRLANEIKKEPIAVADVFSNNRGKSISVLGELCANGNKKQLIYKGVYKKGA